MAEESAATPKMERISFQAKLSAPLEEINSKVQGIPFYASSLENGLLSIARVESRNIKKMPYLFYVIEIKEGELSVSYSIPSELSEVMRRAQIMKDLVSLAALLSAQMVLDQGKVFQYLDSVMDPLLKGLSQQYSTLFNQYNTTLSEYRALKRLNLELSASNRNLTVQAEQLSQENKRLSEELKKLQKYSDESLMIMVQDWLDVHNNTIDVNEFAKTYGINAPRAEEILDKMVSMGYLELKN